MQLYIYIIVCILLSVLLYYCFVLLKFISLHMKLKNNNTILICDIADISKYYHKFVLFFKFFIYDMNDDKNIISHLIKHPSTKILLETEGGYINSNDRLINHIVSQNLQLTIYVVRHAYSAGSVLAMASHDLYLDKNACLGPTDPQITLDKNTYSIKSIMKLCEEKDKNYIMDVHLLQYYESKKLYDENVTLMTKLLNKKFKSKIPKNIRDNIIDKFTNGNMSHHIPISCNSLEDYMVIHTQLPNHIYDMFNMYNKLFY